MKQEKKLFILFVLLNPVSLFLYIILFGIPIYVFIYGTYLSNNYSKITNELLNKMLNYPGVTHAEIILDDDFFELQIALALKNEGTLLLTNVNERLKGNFVIIRVGNYRVVGFNRSFTLKDIELVLGIVVKSVKDVVINYDKIYTLLETWPNLSELKEKEDKSVSNIIDRLPHLFKRYPGLFANEECVFATMDWNDEWNNYH
jgi:hypothetical protein